MKKILITLSILFGAVAAGRAQTAGNFELGVNTGLNIGYVSMSGSGFTSNPVLGFNLGVSGDYYFSDSWSIKAKAIYDQKGWGNGYLDETINGNTTTYDGLNYKLNYVTVPVMANWHFGRTRNWYLNFGPYAGFLLNASVSSNPSQNGGDVKSYFNSTDFGLALGIGVKFPLSDKVKLFIEDDGQAGVTNIFKSTDGSSLQSARSSLNIGFNFSLD